MRIYLLLAAIVAVCLSETRSAAIERVYKPADRFSPYSATSFDYNYGVEPRRALGNRRRHSSTTTTTTQRPIIRYWNNFVRNVQFPLPGISWNMTNNPLTNLFTAGVPNVIETPVVSPYTRNKDRKRKTPLERKSTKSPRPNKNRIRHKYIDDDHTQDLTAQGEQLELPQQHQQQLHQQLVLHPFINNYDPGKLMYFYEPNTGEYYEIQRISSQKLQQQLTQTYKNGVENVEETVSDDNLDDVSNSVVDYHEELDNRDEEDIIPEPEPEEENNTEVNAEEEDQHDSQRAKDEQNVEESLRSSIGAYMRDDQPSRQRQRTKNVKGESVNQIKEKSKPRLNYRYYVLQGW